MNNLFEYSVYTGKSQEFVDISHLLEQAIEDSGIQSGLLVVFCPHTTVGITINENADPDVVVDLIRGLEKVFPKNADYRHYEGNSHAHLKASCMGSSCNIIIADGKPILGTWQGIYLCEFDAPRVRKVYISRIQNKSDA